MAGPKESAYFEEAERLYLAGHTYERIAEILPKRVSLATLSKWAKKGDWDKKRSTYLGSLRNAADILQEVLEAEIVKLRAEGGLDVQKWDAICKIGSQIDRMKRGAYDFRTMAVEVMTRFAEWLRTQAAPAEERDVVSRLVEAWFGELG